MLKPQLTQPCSIDIDAEPKSKEGHLCSQCSKNVFDFRGLSVEETREKLISVQDAKPCGTFRRDQVEVEPTFWQSRIEVMKHRNGYRARFILMILVVVVFVSSCISRRRNKVCGEYLYSEGNKNGISRFDN